MVLDSVGCRVTIELRGGCELCDLVIIAAELDREQIRLAGFDRIEECRIGNRERHDHGVHRPRFDLLMIELHAPVFTVNLRHLSTTLDDARLHGRGSGVDSCIDACGRAGSVIAGVVVRGIATRSERKLKGSDCADNGGPNV